MDETKNDRFSSIKNQPQGWRNPAIRLSGIELCGVRVFGNGTIPPALRPIGFNVLYISFVKSREL